MTAFKHACRPTSARVGLQVCVSTDKPCAYAAGDMKKLLSTNPGLKSRFATTIDFPDYSADELMRISEGMLMEEQLTLSSDAYALLNEVRVGCGEVGGVWMAGEKMVMGRLWLQLDG